MTETTRRLDIGDVEVATTLPTSLSGLADQINHHHREAEAALNAGLGHALEAGRLLLEAKSSIPHGQWGEWITAHCHFRERTARGYMRIATRWPELQTKRQRAADLSQREALRLLSEPKNRVEREISLPELRPDTVWSAAGVNDLLEIWPVAGLSGYYRVAHYCDLDSDNADVVYDRRGVQYSPDTLCHVLTRVHHFAPVTDWYPKLFDGADPWFVTAPGVPAKAFL